MSMFWKCTIAHGIALQRPVAVARPLFEVRIRATYMVRMLVDMTAVERIRLRLALGDGGGEQPVVVLKILDSTFMWLQRGRSVTEEPLCTRCCCLQSRIGGVHLS